MRPENPNLIEEIDWTLFAKLVIIIFNWKFLSKSSTLIYNGCRRTSIKTIKRCLKFSFSLQNNINSKIICETITWRYKTSIVSSSCNCFAISERFSSSSITIAMATMNKQTKWKNFFSTIVIVSRLCEFKVLEK